MFRSIFITPLLLVFTLTMCAGKEQSQVIKTYYSSPEVFIPSGVIPSEGKSDAKVIFDVFFDPYCPPCRAFDKELTSLVEDPTYKDLVKVNHHLFPLGDNHFPNDTLASYLHLEMAKRGFFKEFRKAVVNDNIIDIEQMRKLAEQFAKVPLANSVLQQNKAIFDQESKIAANKKIDHTPTVFVNNRNVDDIRSLDQLKEIVNYLAKN